MNEIGRRIVDKLIELHGSIRFVIAFLPYKRSMWNSMESVYQECIASGIEAHCMPIPYYCMGENKRIDHIASDYELFGDIAEPIGELEHIDPDYIAIHYQYEDHNKVTNMLPEYYTQALKERYHCKMVFLPYGIRTGAQHYSVQPGLRHIDYAFLESEEDREAFIVSWRSQGIEFSDRAFAFGSPKIDAARKTERLVPEEWKDIIGNRSVTLIINSLGPYLTDPLQRILIYQTRAEVEKGKGRAVIFRPHPLMRDTIRSMRPGTASAYEKMLDRFRKSGIIVDESEYLERALSAADRLLSDPSSVLAMWQATGREWEMLG